MTGTDPAAVAADDWETHWGDYASTAEDNPAQEFRRRLAFDLLSVGGPPVRLFDIGAGQGDLLTQAAATWPDVRLAGVELDREGVAEALGKVPQADLIQGDLLRASAPPPRLQGWATHAVCSEVLEHVDDPIALLRNARAFLAPGCRVVVTVPGGPRSAFDKYIGHRKHYRRESLTALMAQAGLTDIDAQAAGFPIFNLYKLLVILRGKKVIADVRSDAVSSTAGLAMRVFDRLFVLARRRGRFGWQIVATATSP